MKILIAYGSKGKFFHMQQFSKALEKLGVELEELTTDQANYIGVKREGPFKPSYYRY